MAAAEARADELASTCNQLRTLAEQREKSALTLHRKARRNLFTRCLQLCAHTDHFNQCKVLRRTSETVRSERPVCPVRSQVEKMSTDSEKSEAAVATQGAYIARLETRLLRLAGRSAVAGAPAMPHSPPQQQQQHLAAADGGSPAKTQPPGADGQLSSSAPSGVEELTGRFEEGLLQELSQLRATVEEFGARAVRAHACVSAEPTRHAVRPLRDT